MASDFKKAGLFLDGCSIYISGFKGDEKDKLNRVLNSSGATRFDDMEDDLSHIIVAQNTCDKKLISLGKSKGIHVVTLNWLLDSIKQRQPCKESNYQVEIPLEEGSLDCPSPSSKKTLKSMNHSFSFKQPEVPKKKLVFEENENLQSPYSNENDENDLLSQYKNLAPTPELPQVQPKKLSKTIEQPIPEQTSQMSCNTEISSLNYENLTFLEGMSVYIEKTQFEEEFYTQMVFECESAQGKVVSSTFKDVVDYVLVSFEKASDIDEIPVRAKHIVNELWIVSIL